MTLNAVDRNGFEAPPHHELYFFSNASQSPTKMPDPSGSKRFLTQEEVVQAMQECERGTLLLKVKTANKILPRFVQLFERDGTLQVQSKKGLLSTKSWMKYDVTAIHDIRNGRRTNRFMQCRADSTEFDALHPDSRCFSVCFHTGSSLDFIAPSEQAARQWQIALSFVVADYSTRDRRDCLERWLLRNFRLSDANRDGFIDFQECQRLLYLVNIGAPAAQALEIFKNCQPVIFRNIAAGAGDDREVLDQDGFMRFYARISERPELHELFNLYCTDEKKQHISDLNLLEFMQKSQNLTDCTKEDCQRLIQQHHEPDDVSKTDNLLSYDGFKNLMFAPDQMLIKYEAASKVYQDMSRYPLNDYFIASSHNTYLMGNQLTSLSSTDGYAQALKLGCRCIEMDIFDGSEADNNEPVIYHKYTITNALRLSNALQVIKEYAFKSSPYPLILSFESHVVQLDQQRKMARQIQEIFGDMLLKPVNYQEQHRLPAPSEILNKIIIKHKRLPLAATHDDDILPDTHTDGDDEKMLLELNQLMAQPIKFNTNGAVRNVNEAKRSGGGTGGRRTNKLRSQPPPRVDKLARELSDLVVYCVPRKFTTPLGDIAKVAQWYEIMAIAEHHGLDVLKSDALTFAEVAKKVMFRLYPGSTRFNSSNYDPCAFWVYGAQIVALNYQCLDDGLLVNIGKFLDNGNCGYVLKPDYLRSTASADYTRECLDPLRRTPTVVTIRLISGQQLPKAYAISALHGTCLPEDDDIPDPFVSVHVFGHELDRTAWQSQVVSDNGFAPQWNEELTLRILFPEVAIILFQVKDYDTSSSDDLIGWKAMPLTCMQQGYRHVGLISPTLEPMPLSTLFVKVDIQTSVASPALPTTTAPPL